LHAALAFFGGCSICVPSLGRWTGSWLEQLLESESESSKICKNLPYVLAKNTIEAKTLKTEKQKSSKKQASSQGRSAVIEITTPGSCHSNRSNNNTSE